MRPTRLLIPLALLTFFASAMPAAAADWGVGVVDYEFQPQTRQIEVGDSVTWNFGVDGHTTTSKPGQPDSWTSAPDGATNSAGVPFTKVFNTPGRYQYICVPHQTFMKGVDPGWHRHGRRQPRQLQVEAHRQPREAQLPAERAGHGHLQADRQVTPDSEARPPRRRPAQLHAAPPEARHLPREC